MATEKQISYPLIIDEVRDDVLGVMMAVLALPLIRQHFVHELAHHGLEKDFITFASEINDRTHAAGFCKDPKCSYPQKNGNTGSN